MKKAPEAFRTISEVADLLDTPAHVLRFWESKFYQIRPVKRAGGRRYYRPDDVALINGIKILLQDRGMTIRGAQRILQEQGARAVAQLGLPLPQGGALLRVVPSSDEAGLDLAEADDATTADSALPDGPGRLPDVVASAGAFAGPVASPAPPPDELAVETRPAPGYVEAEAEGEVGPRSGREPAVDGLPQGDGATNTPLQPRVEDSAMSSDELLAAPAHPPPDIAAPAPTQDRVAAMLRPRPPATPPPAEAAPQIAEIPDRARIARGLRAVPRHAPGLQRDRLALLARRIDTLLERMSEASGAGRW